MQPAFDRAKRMVGCANVSIWTTNEDGHGVTCRFYTDTNNVDEALFEAVKKGGVKLVIYNEQLLDYLVSVGMLEFSLAKGIFCMTVFTNNRGSIRFAHKDECEAIARFLCADSDLPNSTYVVVERCAWTNMVYELTKDQNFVTFWRTMDSCGNYVYHVKVASTSGELEMEAYDTAKLIDMLNDEIAE